MMAFFVSTKFPMRASDFTCVPTRNRANGPMVAPSSTWLSAISECASTLTSSPITESTMTLPVFTLHRPVRLAGVCHSPDCRRPLDLFRRRADHSRNEGAKQRNHTVRRIFPWSSDYGVCHSWFLPEGAGDFRCKESRRALHGSHRCRRTILRTGSNLGLKLEQCQ